MTKTFCDLCKQEKDDLKDIRLQFGSQIMITEIDVCSACRSIIDKELRELLSKLRIGD